MDFSSMSWFYFHALQQKTFYCGGNSTNNHVAFALTVSKCSLGSFKRQLNFSAPYTPRDREDAFTELFLKEKYTGYMFLFLAPASWMSQLKHISHEKICFCNLFDHIKIGSRFVCWDNVCWVWGSQSVSHFDQNKHWALPYPVVTRNLSIWAERNITYVGFSYFSI